STWPALRLIAAAPPRLDRLDRCPFPLSPCCAFVFSSPERFQAFVNACDVVGPGEAAGALAALAAHLPGAPGGGDECPQGVGERFGVGLDEETGLGGEDALARPAAVYGDDGLAVGHRFERDEAPIFVERGEEHGVTALVETPQ